LIHGSILYGTPGQPIFTFDQDLDSVTISGLTFDGPEVKGGAKGIANDSGNWLINSTIRDNYFSTHLSEGIYTPMQSTRIERNHFGTAGDVPTWPYRHIYSVPLFPPRGATNQNWIVYNQFFHAFGPESIRFEQGAQLHIVGNQFEKGHSSTALQIDGLYHVVIEGNYFELCSKDNNNVDCHTPGAPSDAGQFVMKFSNTPDNQSANYIAHLENNHYNMDNSIDNFIFSVVGATTVYMSYETGTSFLHTNRTTRGDLTDQYTFSRVNPCVLLIRRPLWFGDYAYTKGTQVGLLGPTDPDPRQTSMNHLCRE
jgi:hypothetical protein